jgi:hypothetical protein
MAYNIVKSDNTPLATINDGQTNTTATSLTLVGKNFAGYGTFLNENFVKLLEHFASANEPAHKITGQLWYQTSTKVLQVYNGSAWKSISGAQSVADEPTYKVAGDLWFDSVNQQLKVWSGAGWVVIGPSFTSTTGTSGAVADTVIDSSQFSHVVVKFFVQNQLVAVLSKDAAFQPATTIPGFPTIKPGLNLARGTSPELIFYENANNASYLGSLAADQYLTKDNALLTSKLVIRNNDGIELEEPSGTVTNFQLNINNNNIQLLSLIRGNGFIIRTKPDNAGGAYQTVLAVDKITGLITVLNDPTQSAGIATKNYVDNRDDNTRTMLLNNVTAINSNVSTLKSNTDVVYGNVRTLQNHLGFRKGGANSPDDQKYTELFITNNESLVGNLYTLWSNVATIVSNVLTRTGDGGPGGTVGSSMYANVRSIQGRVSNLENDAFRRDGTLTLTGSIIPSSEDARDVGSTGFRMREVFATKANIGAITNLASINLTGARGATDSFTIRANPVTLSGNLVFDDLDGGTASNPQLGVLGDVRITGRLQTVGHITIPNEAGFNEQYNIGSSNTFRYNNIYVKTVNADAITLTGTGGLSSSADASFGSLTINNLFPSADITYDLGKGSPAGTEKRWLNVYARNFISDTGVTLTATGANKGIRWYSSGTSGEADIGTSSMRFGVAYVGGYSSPHLVMDSSGIKYQTVGASPPNDGTQDIGTSSRKFGTAYINNVIGTASSAKYADLAERFAADAAYPPGTLLKIGGEHEVTLEDAICSAEVLGVVSTQPAYLMNREAGDDSTHPAIALSGRVPVRVVGPIRKGQRLVSAGNGCAKAANPMEASWETVIGRALETNEYSEEKLVMSIIKVSL